MTIEVPEPVSEPLPAEFCTAPTDPNENYAKLRATCPVRKISYPPRAEAYVVADYDTVTKLFKDPRLSKSVEHAPEWFREALKASSPVLIKNMLTSDPPEHTRLRKLVSKAFVPKRMELLRPRIQEIVDDLIDAFPESGQVDLYNEFAWPLPMRVICEFLGIPTDARDQLHEWGMVLSGAPYATQEGNDRLKQVSDDIERYLLELLAKRRTELRDDDLVSILITAADTEDVFTEDELVSTLVLLIIAGHKTTSNLVGNGMQALLQNPDQYRLLLDHPEYVESAIDEFLRYEGPVYRAPPRYAAEDMRIGDLHVAKESIVHLLINSANRDGELFGEPDRLDITRKPNRHLSFGHGIHFCPGAPLSKVEGQVAYNTLLRRLPGLRLVVDPAELQWRYDNSASRGLDRLPVAYDKRLPA